MLVRSKYKSLFIIILAAILFVIIGFNQIGKVRADFGFKYVASGPDFSPTTFKYSVDGAKKVTFIIEVKYENDYYNYSYEIDQDDQLTGNLALPIASDRVSVDAVIIATSEKGKKSDPLNISTKWYRILPFIIYRNVIPYNFTIKE